MRHCVVVFIRGRYGVNWGGIERKHPHALILRTPLKAQYLTAKNGNRRHTTQTSQIAKADGRGIRLGDCKSLHDSELEQSTESGVIKSGVICENPENERLADVISAWSFLPSHIQEAILVESEKVFLAWRTIFFLPQSDAAFLDKKSENRRTKQQKYQHPNSARENIPLPNKFNNLRILNPAALPTKFNRSPSRHHKKHLSKR